MVDTFLAQVRSSGDLRQSETNKLENSNCLELFFAPFRFLATLHLKSLL